MRKSKKGYKKPKVEVVEFDKELYKKNLEETEQFTNDPDGIGDEKDGKYYPSDDADDKVQAKMSEGNGEEKDNCP